VLRVTYGDSSTIRIANIGRRRRKDATDRGYLLDLSTGRWAHKKDAEDSTVDTEGMVDLQDVKRPLKVIPYVEDRRNLLVLRLAHHVDDATATTLRYALERGAEAVFQLEDSELDSQSLPDLEHRGRMLFTEAAEGGAGALRRLVSEPGTLADVASKALEIAHFDPTTGADLGHSPDAPADTERCELACYECLLAYNNQHEHSLINRHLVRDLLLELSGARVRTGAGGRSRDDQRTALAGLADSSLEKDFVTWLDEHAFRLPDRAQILVPEAQARPDLIFDLPTGPVAVFVDGPVHDHAAQQQRDSDAQERLEDAGWMVIRVRHDDAWDAVVAKYPSVFGSPGADRSTTGDRR